jgi:hypothetical protein
MKRIRLVSKAHPIITYPMAADYNVDAKSAGALQSFFDDMRAWVQLHLLAGGKGWI